MILRKAAILLVIFFASFLLGAMWLKTKAFPYQYITQLDQLEQLNNKFGGVPKLPGSLTTAFTRLEVKSLKLDATYPLEHNGGGMFAIGNRAIIVSKRGRFFLYNSDDDDGDKVQTLDISMNINYEEFLSFVNNKGLDDKIVRDWFRFIDVLYHENANGKSLLLSHYYWDIERECFTVRISGLSLPEGEDLGTVTKMTEDWNTIYDTKPCVKIKQRGFYFPGHFSGGRMELLNENELLFTVGFLGFDGNASDNFYSQGTDGDYGKILKINLQTGQAIDFSIGHRNPQGLAIDRNGKIWSTEHGPKGGDELNLIEQGANYGWPYVTHGSDYGKTSWPLSESQGRHDGYQLPVFSWVPSIGVSNLIEVKGFLPEWDGDLLIGSLKQQTIFRLRYREDRAVFLEPINIGERIRDIDQLDNGNIILWTDKTWIIELKPGEGLATPDVADFVRELDEPQKQEAINAIHSCQMCHSISSGGATEAAPNLWAVFDRKIAGTDFDRYSPALRSKKGNWNEQNLNLWLEDSNSFANGTSMAYPGISHPAIRKAVIDYLKALH
ncbi:MAG: cytochrome c2 [Paraglaciecola sp.]|jgi:cytochrome c2